MKESTEDKFMHFLGTWLEPFSLGDLLVLLGEPNLPSLRTDLASYLVYNQLAYALPCYDEEDELWLTRAGLYTGHSFPIVPTRQEIAAGVLIPGSRLVPFNNPSVLPHEIVFSFNGKQLPRTRMGATPEDVYPLYQLFGDEYVPQYLSMDNDENSDLFSGAECDDPLQFSVMAVDARNLYWKSGFTPGDRIMARLVDWRNGCFELSVQSASAIDSEAQKKWMSVFETYLLQTFDLSEAETCIDDQLSLAFFIGQDELFTPNMVEVRDFLRWSEKVAIEPYGVESRLWRAGEIMPSREDHNLCPITTPRNLADEAFIHLGLPVTAAVVDAYLHDALFRGESGIDPVLHRLVPSDAPHAQICQPVVARFLQLRFRQLQETYNRFADNDVAELRTRYVDLHSALGRSVGSLIQSRIDLDLIPEQGFVVLSQLLDHSISSLESLEFTADGNPDLEALWTSVEGMEDSFFDIKTMVQEVLPGLQKRRFTIIRKKERPDE